MFWVILMPVLPPPFLTVRPWPHFSLGCPSAPSVASQKPDQLPVCHYKEPEIAVGLSCPLSHPSSTRPAYSSRCLDKPC